MRCQCGNELMTYDVDGLCLSCWNAKQAKAATMSGVTYTYEWANNSKRATMKGRPCRILHTLSRGSVYIEFTDDGQKEVTSRRALRRAKCQE